MAVATLLQDAAGFDRMRCKATGIRCWICSVVALFAFLGVFESVLVLDLDQLGDLMGDCYWIFQSRVFSKDQGHYYRSGGTNLRVCFSCGRPS